ncbi:MAG: MBL fold metallo-hydrolase [Anaerolineae bacterium SM23_84]|nr:MAG: MBL fold metallo-hydrolase [Anaerolineae bacterium SM23_84]
MKITFMGAAQTVTGSMHMLEVNGSRILLDCGLFQGRRRETYERNRNLPFDGHQLDAVILSHAHIDHSGNIPNLVKSGYRGNIYATSATRDLCSAMLLDSGHIQESDVRYVNKRRKRRGLPPVEPIYTVADARASLDGFVSINYRRPFNVAPGVQATFYDAGHILGSAITVLDVEESGRSYRLCFTGDLGRRGLPIIRDPETVHDVDYVITESTYGAREHESPLYAQAILSEIIHITHDRGGKVIIPSFAVGRTQEIVFDLHKLIVSECLPDMPVYVDSPLAVNVTEIFRLHPECYDAEVMSFLQNREDPFGFYRLHYTRSVEESKALNDFEGPCIIISASGMCEAGRILHHLKHHIGDPRNTVLFVGFQVENTLGRKILDGQKEVPIFGDRYRVDAQIRSIQGYSAHADRNELLAYIRRLMDDQRLKQVFSVHGDLEACQALAEGIRALGMDNVLIPQRMQVVEI